MLKFFFWFLLAANGILFAFHQGHLKGLIPDGREPVRLLTQVNPAKIKLVSPAMANAAAAAGSEPTPAGSEPTPAAVADKNSNLAACTEIGNFNSVEAKRFEAQLSAASPAAKLARRELQEQSSHMVLIPPKDGKPGADKKVSELRKLGVTDFYVIQDSSGQRWGISLGIFKSEEAARAQLEVLNQKGVRSARLIEHQITLNKVAFQLRGLDADAKSQVDKIRSDFPRQEVRNCD